MLESSKHHDGQLLVRRKSDADKVQVSKINRLGRRDKAHASKQSYDVLAKKDNGLLEKKRVGWKQFGPHCVSHSPSTASTSLFGFGNRARARRRVGWQLREIVDSL
jgi:hypothetical protein